MAIFKISRGNSVNLPSTIVDGQAYFCIDTGDFFIDYADDEGVLHRKQMNAEEAKKLTGYEIVSILNSNEFEIPTSKVVADAIALKADAEHNHDERYYTEAEIDEKLDAKADSSVVSANYDESIIGLSVDGQVVTYIKGDGSKHTFVTQDTDTTYSLGTDEATGLTKLYATTGSAEDGTMTQKAIKTELDKKVGVSVDEAQGILIFTI